MTNKLYLKRSFSSLNNSSQVSAINKLTLYITGYHLLGIVFGLVKKKNPLKVFQNQY